MIGGGHSFNITDKALRTPFSDLPSDVSIVRVYAHISMSIRFSKLLLLLLSINQLSSFMKFSAVCFFACCQFLATRFFEPSKHREPIVIKGMST